MLTGRSTTIHGRLRQVIEHTLEFDPRTTAGVEADHRGAFRQRPSARTIPQGATLEIIDVPAVLVCKTCQNEWEIKSPAFICGTCGPGAVEVETGEEFMVESIEVEDERGPACTAPR